MCSNGLIGDTLFCFMLFKYSISDSSVLFTFNGSLAGSFLTFNFNGTVIPAGFSECSPSGALVTVSDGTLTYNTYIQVLDALATGGLANVDLSNSGLSTTANYNVSIVLCVTDGNLTCEKSNTVIITNEAGLCNVPTGVTATIS